MGLDEKRSKRNTSISRTFSSRTLPLYLERCRITYIVELPSKYWYKKATYTQVMIMILLVATELTLQGEWLPAIPSEVFLSFFLDDKTSAPDVFSGCSFIP